MAVHHFKPDHYHVTIGSHEPVLRIANGDTVITTTVDAAGCDSTGRQVTERGNPQTGPFYVEGAQAGDTLAVHLEEIVPNRRQGYSASVAACNTVDPEYVRSLPEPRRSLWTVDLAAQTVTLTEPQRSSGPLRLPLKPMLGCFGVAPPRGQAISTATAGPYGGNMDFNGFGPGSIAYFPVFVPGALFHLGDGHAVQGDGEILGTGVEISMNVRFTVRVIKGMRAQWPRGENAEEIFTVGNARPFDQALQHATTEMLRWLQEGYGMDAYDAHLLLGQAVRYSVGNFFDPAYTAVCRLPKALLPTREPAL